MKEVIYILTIEDKEKAVLRFLKIAPQYSNEEIAHIFKLSLERIAQLRKEFDAKKRGGV